MRSAFFYLLLLAIAPSLEAAGEAQQAFDPAPWIADLGEMRTAFSQKYANFEWAVFDHEVDLTDLFTRAGTRLRNATSEAEARAAIDRLTRNLGDGHVVVVWPRGRRAAASGTTAAAPAPGLCERLGYDAPISGTPLGPRLPGYEALTATDGAEFPAGIAPLGSARIGVLRIDIFDPHGLGGVCTAALHELSMPADAACDAACAERLEDAAYTIISRDLARRIRALRAAGASTLVIDLTGNGGGSEWAEAVARMLTARSLRSERLAFVRGAHWIEHWRSTADGLRKAAESAPAEDRARLLEWAAQADQAQAVAATPCASDAFWTGQHPSCEWLGTAFYATGILGEGDATALRKKPWGALVFTPAEFDFEPAVWRGPLLVLVDADTGSAASEFTAVLQDNRAAIVVGAPALGGCGHTNGGTPTTLTASGARFEVPDCARLRLDGSNEMVGIDPDVLVGYHATDGIRRKAQRLALVLPRAVAAAHALEARVAGP